jgi:hypothetical protein
MSRMLKRPAMVMNSDHTPDAEASGYGNYAGFSQQLFARIVLYHLAAGFSLPCSS